MMESMFPSSLSDNDGASDNIVELNASGTVITTLRVCSMDNGPLTVLFVMTNAECFWIMMQI